MPAPHPCLRAILLEPTSGHPNCLAAWDPRRFPLLPFSAGSCRDGWGGGQLQGVGVFLATGDPQQQKQHQCCQPRKAPPGCFQGCLINSVLDFLEEHRRYRSISCVHFHQHS